MKSLKRIKNNFIERNASLVKLAFKSGKGILFGGDDPAKILSSIIGTKPEEFSEELALYKGSILKAGQLLSLYGEYYLPKEINQFLDKLKSQSHYLSFQIIKKQIPEKILASLEIEEIPIAAASIGQVHLAKLKSNPCIKVVLKVQYKGIEKAIGTDVFFIKLLLKSAKFLPKGINFDSVFEEVKRILILETDYENEAKMIQMYTNALKQNLSEQDSKVIKIPEVLSELSTQKIITMDYLEGDTVDEYCKSPNDQGLSNIVGELLFKIFLLEIFKIRLVQTDAHGGNYLINSTDRTLGLIDFGACVEYSSKELKFYQEFLYYSVNEKKDEFFSSIDRFFQITNNAISYDRELLWEYVSLATTPIRTKDFSWGQTKIVDELFELGLKLEKTIKAKNIPHQFIFIDRKVVGLFILLKKLNANFDVEKVFSEITKDYLN